MTSWTTRTGDADTVPELAAQADVEVRGTVANVVREARLADNFRLRRRSASRYPNSREAEESDQKKRVLLHNFSFLYRQTAVIWLPRSR
jgi:hypothetical protein